MFFRSVIVQYSLEALALVSLAAVTLVPALRRRDPRKVLLVLSALNLLRFGGVAGALAALPGSRTPAFLAQVAIGDGLTAAAASLAVVLFVVHSRHATVAVVVMNALGWFGILTSELWLQWLETSGRVTLSGVHAPSIGAALFTALHVLALYVVARARTAGRRGQGARDGVAQAGALG